MYRIAQTNFCVSSLYSVVGFAHDLFFHQFLGYFPVWEPIVPFLGTINALFNFVRCTNYHNNHYRSGAYYQAR